MLFGKKTAVALSSMILLSVIGACSSNMTPMPVAVNGNTSFADSNLVTRISADVTQSKQDPNHFYIDAGKGQTTGASITVKLNLSNGSFKTKSANGTDLSSVASDIASFNIALIDSVARPTALGTPVKQGTIARTTSGGTPTLTGYTPGNLVAGTGPALTTITFTNVPVNVTGTYWIAAAAFNGATTPANITNITAPGAERFLDATLGEFYVTATSATVSAAWDATGHAYFKVAPLTDLALPMKLKDAVVGANVGTAISVADGTAVYDSVTGVGIQ